MLRGSMESQVDSLNWQVIWLGNPPLNREREARCLELGQFLGVELTFEKEFVRQEQMRSLVLGNLENWQEVPSLWPEANGTNTFVALFTTEMPDSKNILEDFSQNKVSFFWNEVTPLAELQEPLQDLLCSVSAQPH